jgi:hypothetical protein
MPWYPTQAKTRLEWGTQPWVEKENCRSLRKGAHAALFSATWQEIRVGTTKGRFRGMDSTNQQGPNAEHYAGCPIQARFWLEWDTTALDAPFFVIRSAAVSDTANVTLRSG